MRSLRAWCPECGWHCPVPIRATGPTIFGTCYGGPWTNGHEPVQLEQAPPLRLFRRDWVAFPQVDVIGQQALVSYLDGRPSIDPADPSWPLQRRAVEFVIEDLQHRDERERREIRRMVRRGELSRVEATRLLAGP